MHGFMIDISERKRAEEALKYLGSRLIAAQEEERKRVARELHDDLNQRMAVLSIELEQLGQKTSKELQPAQVFTQTTVASAGDFKRHSQAFVSTPSFEIGSSGVGGGGEELM